MAEFGLTGSDAQLLIRCALLGAFCAGVIAALVAVTYAMDEQEKLFLRAYPQPLEPQRNADTSGDPGKSD